MKVIEKYPELVGVCIDDKDYIKLTTNSAVTFKCSEVHVYTKRIVEVLKAIRSGKESCHYCLNSKVFTGYNDFATLHPEEAQYCDNYVNGCKASEVLGVGKKKHWFRCSNCGELFQRSAENIKTQI